VSSIYSWHGCLQQFLQASPRTIQRHGNHATGLPKQSSDFSVAVIVFVPKDQHFDGRGMELSDRLDQKILDSRLRLATVRLDYGFEKLFVIRQNMPAARTNNIQRGIDRSAI
jgi:hypothetical protein